MQEKAAEIFKQYIRSGKPMNPSKAEWTAEQLHSFNHAPVCHICNKEFKVDETRVADHCHYTGKLRLKQAYFLYHYDVYDL